jgi:hypothetical protein
MMVDHVMHAVRGGAVEVRGFVTGRAARQSRSSGLIETGSSRSVVDRLHLAIDTCDPRPQLTVHRPRSPLEKLLPARVADDA